MKSMFQAIIGILFLIIIVSASNADAFVQSSESKKSSKLLERIDFNNAYIMGQSIKSGAVYLLKRKNSEIKSMLRYRMNYRDEILEDFQVPAKKQFQSPKQSSFVSEKMFSMDLNFQNDVR
ncbi:secreted protein [Candidatus Magnetomorum sp. HK-1]|nr:secreted protein [Candidatus Magnetomorum sp. HK-1]